MISVVLCNNLLHAEPVEDCPIPNTRPPARIAHASNCQLYYMCQNNGRMKLMNCAVVRKFDPITQSCVPGNCRDTSTTTRDPSSCSDSSSSESSSSESCSGEKTTTEVLQTDDTTTEDSSITEEIKESTTTEFITSTQKELPPTAPTKYK